MTAQDFGELVSHVRRSGTGYSARCPAHEDQRDSLTFADGDRGLVVHCHTGCTIEAICMAIGVSVASLFHERNGHGAAPGGLGEPVATYDYPDETGTVLYQAVRYIPKTFRQRRPDPAAPGGWAWTLGAVRRVCYRLPQLAGQAEVVIVEGEKDADRLAALGFAATTNAMGAGKWRDDYTAQLRAAGARHVSIIPDLDRAGQEHAADVVRSLVGGLPEATVRVVALPGLGPLREKSGPDVSDWLAAGGTAAALRAMIAETPSVAALPQDDPEPAPEPPRTRPVPEPVELPALMARQYPADPGVVAAGVLPRQGLGVIGGGPKLGKSMLVKNLCLRRQRGEPWLGFATTPGVTLYVQAEVPEPELQKRFGLLLKDLDGPPPGGLYLLTDRRIKLDRPDGIARLRTLLDTVRPDLLVLDPLARFFSGDENSARDVGGLVAALDALIEDYGLTILVVHHTGKGGLEPREGGHRLRGSSALFGAADTVLLFDKDGAAGFKLSFELRHGKDPGPLYLTRTPALWFVPAGPPEELMAVAYLVSSGPLRWGQLVQAIKDDRKTAKRTAERLLDRAKIAELIAPDPEGYYRATATYRHAVSGGEVSAR